MENKSELIQKNKKLPALIKLWYYYPVVLVTVILISVMFYFILVQVSKYRADVEKLKKEFPESQRKELIIKVLTAKDFINWVKANPKPQINKYLHNKLKVAENVVDFYTKGDTSLNHNLNFVLDSLNEINKMSAFKLVLMDKEFNFINPPTIKLKNSTQLLSKNTSNLRFKEFNTSTFIDDIIFDQKSESNVFHTTKNDEYRVGLYTGNASKEDILKEIVLDSLSKIKYQNNEYIFINTFDGIALLAKGKRQFNSISISQGSDASWKQIFLKEREIVQNAGGDFYTYFWRNDSKQERKEKTSYFTGEQDWKWIIGTGFFIDDVQPIINNMNKELWGKILKTVINFLIFLILISISVYLITRRTVNLANKNIQMFMNFFKRAAHGMQVIDKQKLAFEEFALLAEAANHMISEREKIKAVLANEKSKLRYIIDAIPDLVFFKSTNSLFEGCNTAFEKYVGKTSAEIAGLSEYDLFGKEKAEKYIKSDKNIFSLLVPERTTEWVTMRNGEKRLFDTLKTPFFDIKKNLLGIIGISRDITEMEETRQRLILAKEKAEEADQLKTAFLANMSHEIRTPMNAIIGFSDLLSDDDLSQEDRLDFISKIKTSGNSLMSLINDIIDIAKIEAGQLRISETELNLNKLMLELQSTFSNLKQISGKEKISLVLTLPDPEANTWVYTDPFRLQQILTNLLNNALKFTEFGSVEFGYSQEDSMLRFFVRDTGIGILRSKQKLLFKRFSQVDAGANRKYGGTGLGLAISSNLVELLGGSISVESVPGKGSTFYFSIPYKPAKPKLKKEINREYKEVDWSGKTILIAEDSMQNYLLVEATLRFTKVNLLHATDGQKAIDMAKTDKKIDLVLMDIQLPVKTGYEALIEIQMILPSVPIISYTAFALPNEREKSLKAGFIDYLPKPIKAETLIPILGKYLMEPGLER